MSTRFFTDIGEQTLFRKFKDVFENNPELEWFDALIGFLRASGYFAIRPYLERIPHIGILVGIDVDTVMADYYRRVLLFLADPAKTLEEYWPSLQAVSNSNRWLTWLGESFLLSNDSNNLKNC